MLKLGLQLHLIGFFAKLLCLPVEQLRWICFPKQEQPRDLNRGIRNGSCMEGPAPAGILCDEATCYGANSWAKKWSKAVHGDSATALVCTPTVTEYAPTNLSIISKTLPESPAHMSDVPRVVHSHQGQTETGKLSSDPWSERIRRQS